MCLLPALIYFQIPLSICFSSSSTAPKSSGASETWGEVKKKKSGREREKSANKTLGCLPILHHSLWEVDTGILPYQALFQNRQTAGMPPLAPVPAFLALCFSSHSFFLLVVFYCWGLPNYAQELLPPRIMKKSSKNPFGASPRRDEEEFGVAFTSTVRQKLINPISHLYS